MAALFHSVVPWLLFFNAVATAASNARRLAATIRRGVNLLRRHVALLDRRKVLIPVEIERRMDQSLPPSQ